MLASLLFPIMLCRNLLPMFQISSRPLLRLMGRQLWAVQFTFCVTQSGMTWSLVGQSVKGIIAHLFFCLLMGSQLMIGSLHQETFIVLRNNSSQRCIVLDLDTMLIQTFCWN